MTIDAHGYTSHEPGALDLLEIGCSVWERQWEGADYEPRGGTVVAIDYGPERDADTGFPVRRFRVARVWRGQIMWAWLRADQIGPVELANSAFIRNLVRAMAREAGTSRGAMDPSEIELYRTASRLVDVIT